MALRASAAKSAKEQTAELLSDEAEFDDGHKGGIFERGRDFEAVGDAHT